MDTKILIETLFNQIKNLQQTVDKLILENNSLKSQLAGYKNKKNSINSHTPPSKDENRPMKNQSLREKKDNKVGSLIVLFTAFQKKTQQTPRQEIHFAEELQKEYFQQKKYEN